MLLADAQLLPQKKSSSGHVSMGTVRALPEISRETLGGVTDTRATVALARKMAQVE